MFQQEKGENTEFKDAVTGLAHFEAHGDRWSSLDENEALALAVVMDRLFQRGGFTVEEFPGRYDMLIQPYGDCRAAAVVSENEEGQPGIDTAYPVLLGAKNALRVTHLHEWGIPAEAEGDVYAESEACGKLAFFDPFWCRDREALAARKEDGAEAEFLLSAWAYRVERPGSRSPCAPPPSGGHGIPVPLQSAGCLAHGVLRLPCLASFRGALQRCAPLPLRFRTLPRRPSAQGRG